jgi:hypothetical protein
MAVAVENAVVVHASMVVHASVVGHASEAMVPRSLPAMMTAVTPTAPA